MRSLVRATFCALSGSQWAGEDSQLKAEETKMVQTNVVSSAQEGDVANDIAVRFDENRRNSRVFGSSRRGDYIFSVR